MDDAEVVSIDQMNNGGQAEAFAGWDAHDLDVAATAAVRTMGLIIDLEVNKFIGTVEDAEEFVTICTAVIDASLARIARSKQPVNEALLNDHGYEKAHHLTRMLYKAALFNLQYAKFKSLVPGFMRDPNALDNAEITKQAALVVFMRKCLLTSIQESKMDLDAEGQEIKAHLITLLRSAAPENAEAMFEDAPSAEWFKIE